MFLDFDRFKLINDTLGHAAGDRFLILVAERLVGQVRPEDLVARLGGDEFAVLLRRPADRSAVEDVARRIQDAVRKPYRVAGNELTSSASIGITGSEHGYDNPDDMLRDADIAMYRAKAAGKARHSSSTPPCTPRWPARHGSRRTSGMPWRRAAARCPTSRSSRLPSVASPVSRHWRAGTTRSSARWRPRGVHRSGRGVIPRAGHHRPRARARLCRAAPLAGRRTRALGGPGACG
jgi:diguanylate cyclase (GGDEF)-like protein